MDRAPLRRIDSNRLDRKQLKHTHTHTHTHTLSNKTQKDYAKSFKVILSSSFKRFKTMGVAPSGGSG